MNIVFTGGGTGGHFYPLIAIAEAIHDLAREGQLVEPHLYYIAPSPFDEESLLENRIIFIKSPAGKIRRYFSFENFTDMFLTIGGYFHCLITLFKIYPDVIISRGGYASIPTVLAARTLGIPIIIHESDAKPGRANLLAARFATRIAISFDDSKKYFPLKYQSKIARTGIPLRKALAHLEPESASAELGLDTTVPTVLIVGGSLGSMRINDTVLSALPDLVSFANVIHQTGKQHFSVIESTSKEILRTNTDASRYHVFSYLSALSLRQSASAAGIIVSRAGSTAIAEISLWHKPSILIPIPEEISHDQRLNAYSYARTGAAIVLEEANLTPHVIVSEIKRVLGDAKLAHDMGEKGATFSDNDAARLIATEAIRIGLSHEEQELPAEPAASQP
jgi:UDP-N-acetylglucosamine--N-acetylmuramyl-(pentapeptide) pyrophosphoryl-undecaprenol N-acetylglucosamine transferase